MVTIDLDILLAPISASRPAGESVEFDAVSDEIKQARQADAEYLSQGDWVATPKVADWPRVKQLAMEVLAKQSKDLQMAGWLTEALVHLHGFSGARDGFTLLSHLLLDFWEHLYPQDDDDGFEQRIAKLAWLDKTVSLALNQIPLTAAIGAERKGFAYWRWQESRDLDNLAKQNQTAYEQAISDGKITTEQWDEAVKNTSTEYIALCWQESCRAREALIELEKIIIEKWGKTAPSLKTLTDSLVHVIKLISKIALVKGLNVEVSSSAQIDLTASSIEMTSLPTIEEKKLNQFGSATPTTREEALRNLRVVADFFRNHEPYSPISYLLDKALRWGGMRLDEWIKEVVHDGNTRDQLKVMLDYSDE